MVVGLFLVLLAILAAGAGASAQTSIPFGHATPMPTGLTGWLMEQQSAFYRTMDGAVHATRTDHGALIALLGLSFFYGIFHAAGPGHGKAVISSYLFANGASWRHGIAIATVSSLVQGLVAIMFVSLAAVLIGATAKSMSSAVRVIEIASYLLIVAIGARLLWMKVHNFLTALGRATAGRGTVLDTCIAPAHGHTLAGHSCHHFHGFDATEVAGPGGWRRGAATVAAVGLRPCSGAILVLVFASTQGVLLIGVSAVLAMVAGTAITVATIAGFAVMARTAASQLASAREGAGALAMRGLEVVAATLVVTVGALLLFGYMATERLIAM
jgi:nickel/cobalt transporter (NicO) family protein